MPSSVLGYETERCNRWTIDPLADSVALSCPRCYAKAAGANARRGATPQVDCRSMHTLHAALCMRIADALEAVARIGSPRLVAYGDLMFGRITILLPQYSRRQVCRGAPRAARAGSHGGGSGARHGGCGAPRQTPLIGQEPG